MRSGRKPMRQGDRAYFPSCDPPPLPPPAPRPKERAEHGAGLLVAAGPGGDGPTVGRVIAADPTPAGPRDVPVCGSAGADPMPRGEVAPTGAGAVVPTWAEAEPQATNTV